MKSTTLEAVITALCSLFARYGIPQQLVIVTMGPSVDQPSFKGFLQMDDVKNTLCPPYHKCPNIQTFVL